MMKVIPASQVREGDIVFSRSFSDEINAWQWVTKAESRVNGIVNIYFGYGGHYEQVESGDLLVVDSSRRAVAKDGASEQSGRDRRER